MYLIRAFIKTTKSTEESIYLLLSSSYRYTQVSKCLSLDFITRDAKQSALEIRSNFCFFFFIFMVVANCKASCYWLHVHCSQWYFLPFFLSGFKVGLLQHGRLQAVRFETASRDTQTLNLSRNASKCYAWHVVSLMSEQQSQNSLLKVDPLSTIWNNWMIGQGDSDFVVLNLIYNRIASIWKT